MYATKRFLFFFHKFESPEIESEFLQSHASINRLRITGALCVHVLVAVMQMYHVTSADEAQYFRSYGVYELAWRIDAVGVMLTAQVAVAVVFSLLLLLWLWRRELAAGASVLVEPEQSLGMALSSRTRCAATRRGLQIHPQLKHGMKAGLLTRSEKLTRSCFGFLSRSATSHADKTRRRTEEKDRDKDQSPDKNEAHSALEHGTIATMMFFHGVSVATAEVWPRHSFILAWFPAGVTLNFGVSHSVNGLSEVQNAVLVLYCFLMLVQQLMKIISGQLLFRFDLFVIFLSQVALNLAIARNLNLYRRKLWLNLLLVRKQNEKLSKTLFDLIPPHYALQLIKSEMSSSNIILESGDFHVVALQLDICDYTTLSASMRPLELAQSVNMLFSEFDRAVTGRNLFKVDTIGDAYIIVGWLHKSHCPSQSWDVSSLACLAGMAKATGDLELEDVQKCADMLCVAGDMLEIVNRLRSQTAIHWNVRIGIAIGSVIAGMLGKHQMRFSVLGEAMQHIARLETMGQPGRVHCSADFVNFVSSRLEGRRCLGQWHVERVGKPAISQDRSLGQVQLGSYMLSRIVQKDQMDAVSPHLTS